MSYPEAIPNVSDPDNWIVEIHFDRPGAFHMHREEEQALARRSDSTLPNILRLYSWSPACLSLGFQQPYEAADASACAARGIDIVRRPTGGRAVLHDQELTYAVIMQEPEHLSIYRAHSVIVGALMASLARLGEGALELTPADSKTRELYQTGRFTNAACFASTARHEVTCEGKKVIGSAQRRFGNVVLQHGSILLNDAHLKLPEILAVDEAQKQSLSEVLRRETATLSHVFGRPISIEESANSVRTNFVEHICTALEALTASPAHSAAHNEAHYETTKLATPIS